ncbi:MAG: DUF2812 domain-containing protein [Anaerotignum sp.]|nr:DUF2812 domain-containing protein [Anaerotignum sp.]
MKKIRRWKGGMDSVQTAQFLHDMAAEGWILDEVGYLLYVFREEEPQELTYRVVTMKEAATGEELAKYEAEGWKKAGNWEEQYVFVKERDLWTDDGLEHQMMVEEIDRRLEREKTDRKATGILGLVLFVFFGIMLFLQYGTDMFFEGLGVELLVQLGPNLVLLFAGGWLVSRRLRKKKERMLDGETVSARDTDWRGSRIRTAAVIAVGVLLIGWALYLETGWNEKQYDLPQEISYEDIAAVRLEKLENAPLIRIGGSYEKQREWAKQYYGSYAHFHIYDNTVTEHRALILEKRTETDQKMKKGEDGIAIVLRTDHHKFITESLAKKQFQEDLEWENEFYENHVNWERELLEKYEVGFDELHACWRDFGEEADIHILCRQGKQVMELNYDGQAEPERILEEIEKVFAAQS